MTNKVFFGIIFTLICPLQIQQQPSQRIDNSKDESFVDRHRVKMCTEGSLEQKHKVQLGRKGLWWHFQMCSVAAWHRHFACPVAAFFLTLSNLVSRRTPIIGTLSIRKTGKCGNRDYNFWFISIALERTLLCTRLSCLISLFNLYSVLKIFTWVVLRLVTTTTTPF